MASPQWARQLLSEPCHHLVSRRRLLRSAALTAGLVVGVDMLAPVAAWAEPHKKQGTPRPIPEGIQPFGPTGPTFHLNLPPEVATTRSMDDFSTIIDFDGTVGLSHVHGTGVGVTDGVSKDLNFDIDCRFLQGKFVGTDGKLHHGTFSFI
jgi:hypothetical protein